MNRPRPPPTDPGPPAQAVPPPSSRRRPCPSYDSRGPRHRRLPPLPHHTHPTRPGPPPTPVPTPRALREDAFWTGALTAMCIGGLLMAIIVTS